MGRLKALFVEPFGHRTGHFSVYPNYMSRAMVDHGLEVSLVTFDGVLGGWLGKEPRIKQYSVCRLPVVGPAFRFISKTLQFVKPFRPFALGMECYLAYALAFRQNRKNKNNIIHILDTAAPSLFFFSFAAISEDCNLICTLHGPSKRQEMRNWRQKFNLAMKTWNYLTCFYLLSLKISESSFMDKIWALLYRRSIRRNHIAFVCLSEDTKQTYRHTVFYDKIVYIPDARPKPLVIPQTEARNYFGLPEETTIFLSFGINHNTKCLEVIFQAAKDLPYDFMLLFAGKILPGCPQNTDPRYLAQKYGLQEKTIIIDNYINDNDMVNYFCASDAFLLSYRNIPIDVSGGFSFAYQCGIPSISVDTGRMGEMVNDHQLGFTFIPEDVDSLREAFLKFLKLSSMERQSLKKNILNYSDSENNWQKMTDGYIGLYRYLQNVSK